MSEEFKIEIVNPEKSFLVKEDVSEVVVPAFEGEMGILKDHISIISFLLKSEILPPDCSASNTLSSLFIELTHSSGVKKGLNSITFGFISP